jgi:hypothetical protein
MPTRIIQVPTAPRPQGAALTRIKREEIKLAVMTHARNNPRKPIAYLWSIGSCALKAVACFLIAGFLGFAILQGAEALLDGEKISQSAAVAHVSPKRPQSVYDLVVSHKGANQYLIKAADYGP